MADNITKPFTFITNTYAKANEVNADFDELYKGVNACINQTNINTVAIEDVGTNKASINGSAGEVFKVADAVSDYDAVNKHSLINILKTMYPVGSIYIGTTSSCPMTSLFGTWTKVAENRVLQGSSSSHAANTTIAAGLPNISGQNDGFSCNGETGYSSGAFTIARGTRNRFDTDESSSTFGSKIKLNASNSNSIYGNSTTVQPPAYVVNIWRRTA